jgi:hypothetical protein
MYVQAAPLGFSLNPFHYVKKAAVATGHGIKAGAKGIYHLDKAVAKNKLFQTAAAAAANAAAPGSGSLVQAGFSTINSKPGQPPGQPPSDGGAASGDDGSGSNNAGGGGGGGALGLSKKQLMIGGAVVGGLVLLVLLMPSKKS